MSKSDILYVKGMDVSESDEGVQGDDDIWDDTQLNNAYDKAIRMANVEVAKRIAMSTNSKHLDKEDNSKSKSGKSRKGTKKPQFVPGSSCKAVYEGDGIEYEAIVLRIINDKECVVKFLGYNNSEIVPLESLKPSLGKDAQKKQIELALLDQENESGLSPTCSDTDPSDLRAHEITSPGSTERAYPKKNKSKKKRKDSKSTMNNLNGFFQHPELPLPMPNLFKLRNEGPMDVPMPPPLPFPTARVECEEQAISSMLLSWYMSGYYTGLYQGLKRSKSNGKRNKD